MWNRLSGLTLLIAVHVGASACGNTPTSPTTFDAPAAVQRSSASAILPPDTLFRSYTIQFSGLAADENRAPVMMYTESGL